MHLQIINIKNLIIYAYFPSTSYTKTVCWLEAAHQKGAAVLISHSKSHVNNSCIPWKSDDTWKIRHSKKYCNTGTINIYKKISWQDMWGIFKRGNTVYMYMLLQCIDNFHLKSLNLYSVLLLWNQVPTRIYSIKTRMHFHSLHIHLLHYFLYNSTSSKHEKFKLI